MWALRQYFSSLKADVEGFSDVQMMFDNPKRQHDSVTEDWYREFFRNHQDIDLTKQIQTKAKAADSRWESVRIHHRWETTSEIGTDNEVTQATVDNPSSTPLNSNRSASPLRNDQSPALNMPIRRASLDQTAVSNYKEGKLIKTGSSDDKWKPDESQGILSACKDGEAVKRLIALHMPMRRASLDQSVELNSRAKTLKNNDDDKLKPGETMRRLSTSKDDDSSATIITRKLSYLDVQDMKEVRQV